MITVRDLDAGTDYRGHSTETVVRRVWGRKAYPVNTSDYDHDMYYVVRDYDRHTRSVLATVRVYGEEYS